LFCLGFFQAGGFLLWVGASNPKSRVSLISLNFLF
jgi:hypothetical protein